jgi:ATP-dependent RNA helicase DeaD
MSGLEHLGLAPPIAAALESFGCTGEDPVVRDLASAAVRGTNLVVAAPPAARYAVPALAGMLSALIGTSQLGLVLAPAHALEEWAAVLLPLAAAAGLPALTATQPGRAARRLREGRLRLLLATPATARTLVEQSALKTEHLRQVILAWPELFPADDTLAELMQDLPAEAQRILVLAAPRVGHPLAERYARRALWAGPLAAADQPSEKPAVRVALTGWSQRPAALASLIESEDPASLVVWCADQASAADVRAMLPTADPTLQVVCGDSPKAALIVAWDLPTPARLAALSAAGDLILLAPPHATGYLAAVAGKQSPVRLRDAADQARDDAARQRRAIRAELERGDLEGALLALSPLFERDDPARVAAALYRLWLARPVAAPAPAAEDRAAGEMARVWVGVGKKDGAGPADLVAALTRELGLDAARIGRIEIRELFSLVEVPAAEAERIARELSGKTIRRRQVVAKLDRGRPSAGSRGPSGSSPRGRPARPRP